MPPSLASALLDVLADRRREALARGWSEVPPWVFCSEAGTQPDPNNVARTSRRVRHHAQAKGVRPLRLHATRHTYATLALEAGRTLRWLAEQLGHADPSLTLKVYAHALPVGDSDLDFADFTTAPDGPMRPLVGNDESGEWPNPADLLARPARLERATFRSAT